MSDPGLVRLVNALVLPGFHGTTLPGWLDTALTNGLAGIVYFAPNVDADDPHQLPALSASIRAANPDAVIAVDEEGGSVSRLEAAAGSTVPSALALGTLDDVGITREAGRTLGELARKAGINMALAPVADVNTNPLNPVIGVRSFGSDTPLVSRHVQAMAEGIQSRRVGACAKHFPGHGDTSTDSHLDLPRLSRSLEEVAEHHLPPFQAAVDSGVQAVMSAHIVIDELGRQPATLNPDAGALLRELGFEGLLITDALDMAAIRATVGSGPGAVMAVQAGADVLCVGNPANHSTAPGSDESEYLQVRDALLQAVEAGDIPPARLEASAERIGRFVEWTRQEPEPWAPAVDWVEVTGRTIQGRAIRGRGTVTGPVCILDIRTGRNVAAGKTADVVSTALAQKVAVTARPVTDPAAVESTIAELELGAEDSVLVLADNLEPGGTQFATADRIHAKLPQSICINAGMVPSTQPRWPMIHTCGLSRSTGEALARRLVQDR
ncbi:glycoside hydrolase family 3 protein [Arthrobacter castelli]|uniref:glycoside hydrolase family 3 protein n=1 Tax=Arthrobacter castelli TaxID=271431 RepID=UPI0004207A38|nr:glycoside hydrolase family 3 N-terminal domain-containing protein [Arthrobacter castelli]